MMALMNDDNIRKWIMDDDSASNYDPNDDNQRKVEDEQYYMYEEPNDYKYHEALRDGIYYIITDLIKEIHGLYKISGDIVNDEIRSRLLELIKELTSHSKYDSSNLDLYIDALSKESFEEDSFYKYFRFLEKEFEKDGGKRHPSNDQHPVGSYHFKPDAEKKYKDLLEGNTVADIEKFLLEMYPEFRDFFSFTILLVKLQTLKILGKHYAGKDSSDNNKTTVRIESFFYKLIQHQTHIRQHIEKLFVDAEHIEFDKKEILIRDLTDISLGMKWRVNEMMMKYGVKHFKNEADDFWYMFRRKYGGLKLKLNLKPKVANPHVYELFKVFPRGTKVKAKLYLFVNVLDYEEIFSNGSDADKNMVKKIQKN